MARRDGTIARAEARRAALLAMLVRQPGMNFRQAVRESGMPAGSCKHHLDMLCREGKAWWTRDGFKIRYFPGTKPPLEVVEGLVRECLLGGRLAELHDFVARTEGCVQTDILDAFAQYPRSSVQHALDRLQRGGLLTVTLRGRYKVYRARMGAVHTARMPLVRVEQARVVA